MTQFQCLVAVLGTCVHREHNAALAFLREENRLLKAQLHGRPVRLRDHERRRLAAIGHRLGRRTLAGVATIATPDTILRWYRELVVGQRTYAGRRRGRPGVHAHIRSLIVRMASENATWGYTRIQGAMKNLGYRVGRSTIARILKQHDIPPSPHRSMTWRTFVRAHWPALLDFLNTEVALIRGWVILWAALVLRRHARRAYPAVPGPAKMNAFSWSKMRLLTVDIVGVCRRGSQPESGLRREQRAGLRSACATRRVRVTRMRT